MSDKVSTCLWFDRNAEEAVSFYTGLLPDSRIHGMTRYGKSGPMPEGTVLAIWFELAGRAFLALNGGPHVAFNDAHSMVVRCDTQEEIDRLWAAPLEGGGREQRCGWLTDRYGLSWQIVPADLESLLTGDAAAADRVMGAVLGMVKLDVAQMKAAHRGR